MFTQKAGTAVTRLALNMNSDIDFPFSVMVPWRSTPSRVPLKQAVDKWWQDNFGITTIACDSNLQPFNLSAARNECVKQSPTEVMVVTDADCLVDVPALLSALKQANETGLAQLPYVGTRLVDEKGTQEYIKGRPIELCDAIEMSGSVGGIMVTTKTTWALHGGQDERFIGWGYEDEAWHLCHQTLLGQVQRHEGSLYFLRHKFAPRIEEEQQIGLDLIKRYLQASGDKEAMKAIVFTERGLEIPATSQQKVDQP
jgi:hypothetical protein